MLCILWAHLLLILPWGTQYYPYFYSAAAPLKMFHMLKIYTCVHIYDIYRLSIFTHRYVWRHVKHSGWTYFKTWIICTLFLGDDLPLCSHRMWTQLGSVPGALLLNLKASSHINIIASLWAAVVLFTDGKTEAKGDQKVRISRSWGWWAAENKLKLRSVWFLGLYPHLLLGLRPKIRRICKSLKRRRLLHHIGDGPRCGSYSLHHWEILLGRQPQAFLSPWYLV